ncbi:MAG: GntR family transcriptional regulator [Defluviitaleaceae bacterium]|nr:GntR family transcriptional regulator [Defluviitaleaceae bacterium]
MKINFNSLKPVYIQISEVIEDDIISGKLAEGSAAYSQLIIARELNVNPATAAKGINKLVSKGVLEKQRGFSMIVAKGAKQRLLSERKETGVNELISNLVAEAVKIGISESEVISEIKTEFKKVEGRKNE